MTRTATVVGGGIGGLSTAVALQAHGWDVRVHERAAGLPDTGTVLGIWPSALAALDRLGLGARARTLGPQSPATTFRSRGGARIATVAVPGLHMITRPDLLGLLADALEPGTVRFGSPVHEPDADTEVIVAADGIHSAVRAAVLGPRYRARYTGSTAWRGTATLPTTAMTETWGPGGLFGRTPRAGGCTNWYASARAREGDRAVHGEAEAVRAEFGSWHGEVRAVLDALGEDTEKTVVRHDLYALGPALPSFYRGRVVFVGDAAHAMSPTLGRGGCEALLDAVALAEHLLDHRATADALAAYDARRRKPTQRIARAAALTGRMVQIQNLTGLRDATMKLALAAAPAA